MPFQSKRDLNKKEKQSPDDRETFGRLVLCSGECRIKLIMRPPSDAAASRNLKK
jgi:hypothetical protein